MSVKKYTDATGVAEIWAKVKSIIPSKTSDLTNDSSFITPSGILDMFYPVGSYYETSDITFNPNVAWGGTWSLETAGQVHVSAGTGYAVSGALTNKSDGGESKHKLTVDEMPSHRHERGGWWRDSGGSSHAGYNYQSSLKSDTAYTGYTGGGQAHNNMQPYIVVKRWHRTA